MEISRDKILLKLSTVSDITGEMYVIFADLNLEAA